MWRTISAVTIATFFHVGTVSATGPFDGEWKGTSATNRMCRALDMTLSIGDGKITGQTVDASGGIDHFAGVVTTDGVLKVHHRKIEGTFSGDTAELTILSQSPGSQCLSRQLTLHKVK